MSGAAVTDGFGYSLPVPRQGGRGLAAGDGERPSAAADVLLKALDRIEQIVGQETALLRQAIPVDLRDFNHRKSHGLLELSRAMRGLDRAALGGEVEVRLRTLRLTLARNLEVLKVHVEAVQEVAGLMAHAVRDAESDGTYSVAARFAGGMQ
jgi:hypothetical protein